MPTQNQLHKLHRRIKKYVKTYLSKNHDQFDESATRIMTNSLLKDVLGYEELEEIKPEYLINGGYADYVIMLNRKNKFVVEVKAIKLDLSEKHLRQSVNYAVNEGIDWVVLTNGKIVELYRVLRKKRVEHKKIFSCDLAAIAKSKECLANMGWLTKQSMLKKELEHYWARFQALEPSKLSQRLYSIEILKLLKKGLKKSTGIAFPDEDILDAVHEIIINAILSIKPKLKKMKGQKDKILPVINPVVVEEKPMSQVEQTIGVKPNTEIIPSTKYSLNEIVAKGLIPGVDSYTTIYNLVTSKRIQIDNVKKYNNRKLENVTTARSIKATHSGSSWNKIRGEIMIEGAEILLFKQINNL